MSSLRAETIFTGKPCGAGHVSMRYAKSGECLICVRERYQCTRTGVQHAPRLTARINGSKRYEGVACPRCGGKTRYTTDGRCVECAGVEERNKYRRRHGLNEDGSKSCTVCRQPFFAKHMSGRYCSTRCRDDVKNERNRQRRRRLVIHPPANCLTCSALFAPKTKNNRYCCAECSRTSEAHKSRVAKFHDTRKRALVALKALEELGIEI